MEPDNINRRREPRFSIKTEATVELTGSGQMTRATTVDMSGCGVLLHFDMPVPVAVGDQVICEFTLTHQTPAPLPYWGVGSVVRVDGNNAAINLTAGALAESKSGPVAATPPEPEPATGPQ